MKQEELKIELPPAGHERAAWGRIALVGVVGFSLGVAWPRVFRVELGPSAPNEGKSAAAIATDTAASLASVAPALSGSALPTAGAVVAAPSKPNATENQELALVGEGKILRCWDRRDRRVSDCEVLQFDPVALPKLKELARCPAALGLEGSLAVLLDVNFAKKEIHVFKGKKPTIPMNTASGLVRCAAQGFSNVIFEDVPHKLKRYTLSYKVAFYPPGKHPEETQTATPPDESDAAAAGKTTSETPASGSGIVSWDTALLRDGPRDGQVIARLVRGTKVKIVSRQNDWYKVEQSSKTGWLYRGAIGR